MAPCLAQSIFRVTSASLVSINFNLFYSEGSKGTAGTEDDRTDDHTGLQGETVARIIKSIITFGPMALMRKPEKGITRPWVIPQVLRTTTKSVQKLSSVFVKLVLKERLPKLNLLE